MAVSPSTGSSRPNCDVVPRAKHTRVAELEQLVARFLGKEDCLVYNMGFATNATTIPVKLAKTRIPPRTGLRFKARGEAWGRV